MKENIFFFFQLHMYTSYWLLDIYCLFTIPVANLAAPIRLPPFYIRGVIIERADSALLKREIQI